MAPDDHDHEHQGGGPVLELEEPSPLPLTDKARATIYLDGLIYLAYNQNRKVLESAVLTGAEHHHVVVKVKLRDSDELLFPTDKKPWNKEHSVIHDAAPFWLYVDSGNKIQENEFSADLHKGDRSFDDIFDFENRHRRRLPLTSGNFAKFNFPHGTSYSAKTEKAKLKFIPANKTVAEAEDKGTINVSNLVGIDITAATNGAGKKWIVLANQDGTNEFFRFELEPDKQYEIKIENRPAPGVHLGPEGHFLQFYELFGLNPAREPQFLVEDPAHPHGGTNPTPASDEDVLVNPPTPDNPPCAPGKGSGPGGLGGG